VPRKGDNAHTTLDGGFINTNPSRLNELLLWLLIAQSLILLRNK